MEAEARASCSLEVTRDGDFRVSFGPAAGVECASDARGRKTEEGGEGGGHAPFVTRAGQRERLDASGVLASQHRNAVSRTLQVNFTLSTPVLLSLSPFIVVSGGAGERR